MPHSLLPNSLLPLSLNQMDVWLFPLETPFANANQLLNEEEMTRANRYHFPHHRHNFTIARAMLRLILARYVNKEAASLTFSYNKHGKPTLALASDCHFNLSHSGKWALLAINRAYPLGVDLECFSARPYYGIGEQLFSSNENRALKAVPSSLLPLAFFHLWAQKEALIKACGIGLSYPTKQFSLPVLPPTRTVILDPLLQQRWRITSFMPKVACAAALCYHPDITHIRYHQLAHASDTLQPLYTTELHV